VIYQHRIVIARAGKLEKRHEQFQATSLEALDAAGSILIGAWEVYLGQETGSAVWQLRQFESLSAWAALQDRVRANQALSEARHSALFPHLDEVNTSILRLANISPALPVEWPAIEQVRGQPRGYIQQRIMRFNVGATAEHHAFYKHAVLPAMEREGARLIGLFDTEIGQGTTNGKSMRSVELRHFDSLEHWQMWREAQDNDASLNKLIKTEWMHHVQQMDSALLRPMDYSRIR
jgi:hypothetical protein